MIDGDSEPAPPEPALPEPAPLRRLRRLVTGLLWTMILATVTVAVLLSWRLATWSRVSFPETAAIPAEERMISLSLGNGWLLAVTEDPEGRTHVHRLTADGSEILNSISLPPLPPTPD
ncbi:MAG: DUF6476 family protein [Pseudomonadota bacterium]